MIQCKFPREIIALLLLLTIGGCATKSDEGEPSSSSTGLPPKVVAMMANANIPPEAIGAIAFRLSDGATLISHRSDASMQPASNMKLLTTGVGLETLGPTFRWQTELMTNAAIVDDQLRGDLVLRGGGDGDFTWEALARILKTLRQKGVRDILGDIILDRTMFLPTRTDIGLPPFDASPEAEYNVIPDALLVNTNMLKLDLEADKATLHARITPELEGVAIDMQMTLIDRACKDWDDGWKTPGVVKSANGTTRIQLRGEFPRDCTASTDINILERDEFVDRLFRTLWSAESGVWRGAMREGTTPPDARQLARHRSRTLADMLRAINKPSDNALTRLLFLTLGTPPSGNGLTTLEQADRRVRAWFTRRGISDEGLVTENGSGLSRRERIRPSQLAALLAAEYRSNWAPEFMSSLPVVGLDGTMRNRLKDSSVAGRARMKTGTLNNVNALAGYVPNAAGQMYVVVAIINHKPASGPLAPVGQSILDALVDWVGRSRAN